MNHPQVSSADRVRQRSRDARCSPGGFTLIELLLVIILIGVLISLGAPALNQVREQGRHAASLNNLRQHSLTLGSSAIDSAGAFPRHTDPHATYSVIRFGEIAIPTMYFGAHGLWGLAMVDHYGNNPFHESFVSPGYDNGFGAPLVGPTGARNIFTSYFYSHSFIAAPDYWNPETRKDDRSQWTRTRLDQVTHPSRKGIVLDIWTYAGQDGSLPPRLAGPVLVGFVDASARSIPRNDFLPAYPGGPGVDYFPFGMPVMHTIDGVRGADVR